MADLTQQAVPLDETKPRRTLSAFWMVTAAIILMAAAILAWVMSDATTRFLSIDALQNAGVTVEIEKAAPLWLPEKVAGWYDKAYGRIKVVQAQLADLDTEHLHAILALDLVNLAINGDETPDWFLEELSRRGTLQCLTLVGGRMPDPHRLRSIRSLRRLNLWHLSVTDADVASLGPMPGLEALSLLWTPDITDATLIHLAKMPDVNELAFRDVPFTDRGFDHLKGMTQLRMLGLRLGVSVSSEKVEELRAARPTLEITR